ncbi:hypothetical protein DY245_15570 [Streptomyces inhibens]|uniref:Uncharacterized protein n=1 Tax=Streptomyces inhibens TaxID=2293571 RepID=A0A371Q420_STRIH|nr:hypothetical protein [Streptomyces inhibens]REK89460.1 hypothetical protein DY245_15570 [Streptomyces inhibens]
MVTLTSRAADASVRSAASVVLPHDAHSVSLSVKGVQTLLFYRLDQQEHARRRNGQAAFLAQIGALETLLQLPVNEPVELDAMGRAQRAAVDRLPVGAVDTREGSVIRRAVRPLTVDLAVVRARSAAWRHGLAQAGQFAPFCARALLLDGPMTEVDETMMQASFYGIGILLPDASGLRMAVQPQPYRPQRHTAAAWCFTEELYQRLA